MHRSLDPINRVRLGDVPQGRGGRQQRRDGLAHVGVGTIIQPLDARVAAVVVRHAEVELARHGVPHVVLEGLEAGHGGGVRPVELDAEPGERGGRLERLEAPAGDDAEVGAGAPEAPEEVRVLLLRGLDHGAVGEHDRRAHDGVQR